MNHSKTHHLKLPPQLDQLVSYFEVNCVAGCCGLDAYDFDRIYASHAVAEKGEDWVNNALQELLRTTAEIEMLPDDWEVICSDMNTGWSKADAKNFFGMLCEETRLGIELGPVHPEDAHPRHDANQRFGR